MLGLGSNVQTQAFLRRIGTETNWADVAVGGSTTLALKSDGTIWGWGENIYGQLGDGTRVAEQASPVASVPGNDWIQVASAGPHSVALRGDGTLWSWGNNWAGQLGDGTTNFSRVPVRVSASTNWTKIWANLIQNVGQQSDGTLWFWGWDYSHSQKGSSIPVPTRVSADTNWVSVGMGDWMVFAIKSDGTLWAWGREAHIYTGASNPSTDCSPMRVGTASDWRACAAFANSCPVFLKRLYGDPRLFGDPTLISLLNSNPQPALLRQIRLPKNVVAFCGGHHMSGAALTADGEVWIWGEALGQHTPANLPLQLCAKLVTRLGRPAHWGEPGPVILQEPAKLKVTGQ